MIDQIVQGVGNLSWSFGKNFNPEWRVSFLVDFIHSWISLINSSLVENEIWRFKNGSPFVITT
jgi:hypothetical protein